MTPQKMTLIMMIMMTIMMMINHLVALHAGLKGVDWVNLADNDTAAESPQRLAGTLPYIPIPGHHGHLERQQYGIAR